MKQENAKKLFELIKHFTLDEIATSGCLEAVEELHKESQGFEFYIEANGLVSAIKTIRAATILGLKEAKDIVDAAPQNSGVYGPFDLRIPKEQLQANLNEYSNQYGNYCMGRIL